MSTLTNTIKPDIFAAETQPWTWIFALALFVSFIQAGTMGANDVGNNFGTSVGSKVLSVKAAIILAAIWVSAGALSIGSSVAKTVGKGIVDYTLYADQPQLFMLGMLLASMATAMWVGFATALSMPVSTTHSIVGAVIGFGLVEFGADGLDWGEVIKIVISWFASPLISGIVAALLYLPAKHFIMLPVQRDPAALPKSLFIQKIYMTFIWFLVSFLFISFITTHYMDDNGVAVGIAFGAAAGVGLVGYFFLIDVANRYYDNRELTGGLHTDVRHLEELDSLAYVESNGGDVSKAYTASQTAFPQVDCYSTQDQMKNYTSTHFDGKNVTGDPLHANVDPSSEKKQYLDEVDDRIGVHGEAPSNAQQGAEVPTRQTWWRLWRAKIDSKVGTLGNKREKTTKSDVAPDDLWNPVIEKRMAVGQVTSACFEAFSAGANDISNAAGTLIAIYETLLTGSVEGKPNPQYWALAFTCLGMVVGLATKGYKVMATIGENITLVTPSRGLAAELGTAIAVLIASKIGVPVSTTHCSVGGVIAVGLCETQGYKKVHWNLIVKMFASWVLTLPAAAGLSAAMYASLRHTVANQGYIPPADFLAASGGFFTSVCNGTLEVRDCIYTNLTASIPDF